MEPERSLPHSQVPATCPCSDPAGSNPYPHISLSEDPSYYFSPIYDWVSQVVSFPQVSPRKPYIHVSSPIRAACPAYLILIDLITRKVLGGEYRSLRSSLRSFLHSPFTSSLLGQNIILSTLFSDTLSLRFSLNRSDQVLHPYKTRKIMVLYILISFIFLDSKLEDQIFCTEW